MQEHTREKILLYGEYLKNYLRVMQIQQYWDPICIWEPFAGEGQSADGEKGSALCAAEIIESFRKQPSDKNILLFLNELDPKRHERLEQSMRNYREFVNISNNDAEDFLNYVNWYLSTGHTNKMHHLFFIDPYGYTQYTRESLTKLLSLQRVDYLIFIPVSHIYRFISSPNSNPAKQFILDLGIDKAILNEFKDINSFADELIGRLKEIARVDFGYKYELRNKDASHSIFHLFFLTRNIKGAEKFLEAKNKIKELLSSQLDLFDVDDAQRKRELLTILQQSSISNDDLYREAIKKGHLSKEINPILKAMEKNDELRVHADFARKKGSFYLTDRNKTIYIERVP